MIQIIPSLVVLQSTSLLSSFILLGKRRAWYAVEKEKNEIIKSMKSQVFLIDLSFRIAFLFGFWENILFTSYAACYYCVICSCRKNVQIAIHRRLQNDALKNLAIFTGKYLRWGFFLINFIKKRLQLRCFPMKTAKCLSAAFYIEHLPFIMLFRNFMWW